MQQRFSLSVPDSVQRKLARYAKSTTRAIVIGDRNGLIEWTNDA
jgi:hypothetical protein